MSAKRALIVDDSRSARSFLARVLEKYDIAVDTAETAEVAIEYLAKARPDVIFMDHMMPGMDGFQAVQLIKNNPATATIPIMMYTSQEGELYLGQARALGAMGVLPKQIKPAEVSTVLHQLRLVPDRRQGSQGSFRPANDVAIEVTSAAPTLSPAVPAVATGEVAAAEPSAAPGATPAEGAAAAAMAAPSAVDAAAVAALRHQFETLLRTEIGDLRRSLSASLDLQSERLLADVRAAVTELNPPPPPPPIPEPPQTPRAPWIVAAVASAAAAVFAVLWWREAQQTTRVMADLVESVPAPRVDAAAAGNEAPPAGAAAAPAGAVAASTPGGAARTDSPWPELTTLAVPYGEAPLAGERLEQLRTLLREVAAGGFSGRIIVTSYPGRFCLAGTAADGFAPAPGETPFARCDLVGNPVDEALTMAQREPLTLVNLIGTIRRESRGAIEVELTAGSEAQRAAPYPADGPQLTAADWNRVAALNNRIEIRLRPAG
jgi:CheY-like chemotaxis protein